MKRKFFLIRHGAKKGEDLDPSRYFEIDSFAQTLSSMANKRLIVSCSNVARSIDTGRRIVGHLSKFVMKTTKPEDKLGFSANSRYKDYFASLQTVFGGDENVIGQVWIATTDELPRLKSELVRLHEGINPKKIEDFHPRNFFETPEEKIIDYLEVLLDLVNSDPESDILIVGHAPRTDFVHLALTGRELNLREYDHLKGIRNFVEPSIYTIEENRVVSSRYRGRTSKSEIEIGSLIERLRSESERRRDFWQR